MGRYLLVPLLVRVLLVVIEMKRILSYEDIQNWNLSIGYMLVS